jgi:hypothetical protein
MLKYVIVSGPAPVLNLRRRCPRRQLQMNGAADDFYRGFQAEQRSIELLRSWLTLDQLREFDANGWFIVRGSDTGERYRITCARAPYNVHELDDDGNVVLRLCFAPKDIDAPGDIMLAQKISLEKDELSARVIANRLSPIAGWPPRRPSPARLSHH